MALPSGMSALAVRMARQLPDAVLALLLPRRLGFEPADRYPLPAVPDRPVRMFIGPANFAGQGWQWAHAAESNLPGVAAVSMAYATGAAYGFPVDQRVPASVYLLSRKWQARQRQWVTTGFTHVIVEAGRSLFGDVYRQSVEQQVRALRSAGVSVALLTHGSDMRDPAGHLASHEFSPFAPGEWALTDTLTAETARNHELRRSVGGSVFVSTPGMLTDVPDGLWLPVVVDPSVWATTDPPLVDGRVPLVVHAPSSTAVKGTHLVEPVLQRLVAEGLIRYERIENVPADSVPESFRRADIVLDQFRIGDYGVAACEAMAAGRVVVGNVDETVRAHVRVATGRDLPVVQADPRTLDAVLRTVLSDPAPFRDIAAAGPGFVADVHDGRASARALSGFLGVVAGADVSDR